MFGTFDATLTSSVSRGAGQIKTFYVDVPPGENDLDVSFNAPDHATDDPVYYYLFSPSDLASTGPENRTFSVHATDATPTPNNPTGNASLITPDPQPGLWEIDVMQGATTDGTVFSQDVTGTVAYNQLVTPTETGLPTPGRRRIGSQPLIGQARAGKAVPAALVFFPAPAHPVSASDPSPAQCSPRPSLLPRKCHSCSLAVRRFPGLCRS